MTSVPPTHQPLVDTPAHQQFRADVGRLVAAWRRQQQDLVIDVRDREQIEAMA